MLQALAPKILPSAGKRGSKVAATIIASTTTPSKSRSTASEAKAPEKRTSWRSRVSAKARANSPARAGTTLLTIIPMAVARHSGPSGRRPTLGASRACQRRARIGKIAVAATVQAIHSGMLDVESTRQISPKSSPRSVNQSRRMLSAIPKRVRR